MAFSLYLSLFTISFNDSFSLRLQHFRSSVLNSTSEGFQLCSLYYTGAFLFLYLYHAIYPVLLLILWITFDGYEWQILSSVFLSFLLRCFFPLLFALNLSFFICNMQPYFSNWPSFLFLWGHASVKHALWLFFQIYSDSCR